MVYRNEERRPSFMSLFIMIFLLRNIRFGRHYVPYQEPISTPHPVKMFGSTHVEQSSILCDLICNLSIDNVEPFNSSTEQNETSDILYVHSSELSIRMDESEIYKPYNRIIS